MGPKVLFQVGYVFCLSIVFMKRFADPSIDSVSVFTVSGPLLIFCHFIAILKINGEKLLQIQDDGGFLK